MLTASDGVGGDYFGMSVSVSGKTAIAGRYGYTPDGGLHLHFVT
ncbi:MAG: hypothetical protein QOH10_1480 [Actinomycetota bacterium]|jgi:hypothetical protein|nr:hypothetical protein [Actinomycetota bacterium]